MQEKIETLEFGDTTVHIQRQDNTETYISFVAPDGAMTLVAQPDVEPDDLVSFMQERKDVAMEVHQLVAKRFDKSASKACRYQKGDIAYLFGRPLVVRVFPTANAKRMSKATHGRASVQSTLHSDISTIDLFVLQTGNYDQRRAAFMGFASRVFANNVGPILRSCCERAEFPADLPGTIKVRPKHDELIQIDQVHNVTWVSDTLVPYPTDCLAYAYLREVIKQYPFGQQYRKSAAQLNELFDRVVPNWAFAKRTLLDKDAPYAHQ